MKVNREDRIKIFEDTRDFYKNNDILKKAIKNSINSQKIYKDSYIINKTEQRFKKNAKIVVSKNKSFEAALNYKEEKVCVLNFASSTNPGGGVEKGSSAQEECLCRCSTLYPCLVAPESYNSFYNEHRTLLKEDKMNSLYNDDCIYTKDVVIFKTDDDYPSLMKEENWKKVDIISCASPNLRTKPSNSMNPNAGNKKVTITDKELYELHTKRIRKIFALAKENKIDVLILGAFGCGAFCNPPEVVSRAMKDIVKEFINDFKVIEFAVYCNEYDTKNFDIFNKFIKFKEKLD